MICHVGGDYSSNILIPNQIMAGFMPDRQLLKNSLSPFRLAGFAPEYSRTLTTVTQPSATCWQGSRTQLRLCSQAYEVVPHARWKLAHHGPR